MTSLQFEMVFEASAEVEKNPHGVECVRLHPGEPCPGYPHEKHDTPSQES